MVVDISEGNIIELDSSWDVSYRLSALNDPNRLWESLIQFPNINESVIKWPVHITEEKKRIKELHHEGLNHDDVTCW